MNGMVAGVGEECWLSVVFTSQSAQKLIYLDQEVRLAILEKSKVAIVTGSVLDHALDASSAPAVCLAPNECYELIFKLKLAEDSSQKELDQFAELDFAWYSSSFAPALIHCSLFSPPITLVQIPLKMTLLNEAQLHKAQLYQPLSLNLELYN